MVVRENYDGSSGSDQYLISLWEIKCFKKDVLMSSIHALYTFEYIGLNKLHTILYICIGKVFVFKGKLEGRLADNNNNNNSLKHL